MNIIYLSQYFPPEIGATQTRAYEMATNLVAMGHRVTMLTEIPNHPSGIIPPDYRSRFRVIEEMQGIRVVRSWVYATPVKTFKTRMAFYLSFMLTAVLNSFFLKEKTYDLVYATSPPLFVGVAGLFIARSRGIPFVFEVRDLWPESAVELGELQNHKYIRWAHSAADLCYRRARAIVGVTEGINQRLLAKPIQPDKIFLIKNGTNPEKFHYVLDRGLEERLGWRGKFVVLYAGIHGVAQGLETIVDAASYLGDHPGIHFALIGEGPRKRQVMAYAKQKGLYNVHFLSEVPPEEISKYISLAGLCLVPLRKNRLFEGALPSKIFDSWSCGKPVLLSVDGEARREVQSAGGGICVEPENANAIAEAVVRVFRDPDLGKAMGEKGRTYLYQREYIRSAQAKMLSRIIENIVKEGS
jgi:glycosyltransferase involved in cell wall biosynthesis